MKIKELLRFVMTGAICFLVEFVALVILRDTAGLKTLAATPIAFLISVIVNYILCVRWVFTGAKDQRTVAKIGFLITSVIGLFLNEGLMWLFGMVLGEDQKIFQVFSFTVTMYMLNKVFATLIVMVWNYITKRMILKRGKKNCVKVESEQV